MSSNWLPKQPQPTQAPLVGLTTNPTHRFPPINAPTPHTQPYVYMSLYAADRRHFTADMSGRLYTPGPYYLAKTLGVLPFALANVIVSAARVGWGGVGWG
jgi:hypothetical protein